MLFYWPKTYYTPYIVLNTLHVGEIFHVVIFVPFISPATIKSKSLAYNVKFDPILNKFIVRRYEILHSKYD